jgi:hypothetical protein
MTFNSLTLEACCDKCKTAWRSRTGNIPKKCHKCGSTAWNNGTRSFTSLILRAGLVDEKTGYRQYCTLNYIDSPVIVSDNILYIIKEDQATYLNGRSPPGSGIILLGNFIADEDNLLKIKELVLAFCFEATFLSYLSTVSCLYNIKSFYQKQATLKKFNEDQLLKEQAEDKRKEETVQAARKRIDIADAKRLKTLECEKIINDDSNSISMEERFKAVEYLGK